MDEQLLWAQTFDIKPTSFRAPLTGGREIVGFTRRTTVEISILLKWAVLRSKSKNNRLPKTKANHNELLHWSVEENLCTYDISYKTSEAILEVAWCCWAQLWSLYKVSEAKNHRSHLAVNNGLPIILTKWTELPRLPTETHRKLCSKLSK